MKVSITSNAQIIKHWGRVLEDYELIKKGKHQYFKTCKELYLFYRVSAKQVLKYRKRFLKADGNLGSLLPQKRGARLGSNRTPKNIERSVVKAYRRLGLNRYELVELFRPYYLDSTPSPITMYRITRKYPLNKKEKLIIKRYEKKYPGELGHIDTYYLPKPTLIDLGEKRKGYLAGLLDDCTRITYAEYLENIQVETVAFFILRALSWFRQVYKIEFERILSDNGVEFTTRSKNKQVHLVEKILSGIGIAHSFTRPYRPQTNGKVEAFWKILHREFLLPNRFYTENELIKNLGGFLLWYNHERRHGGLKYITPHAKLTAVLKLLPNY
jgi:hypothetical protein